MTSNLQDSNTNNNLSGENNMNTTDNLISALITHFTDNPQNFTDYRKNIESILRENIKPISSRSGKTGGDDNWRKELKQRFSGRGAKWVFVSLENIESRLSALELEGIDCSDYRKNIAKSGKAWIRFSGARINNGIKCAAFEVRTEGSTIDHPKQLHLICIDGLDGVIETMPGTPKGLKLEEDSAPMPSKPKVKKEKPAVSKDSKLNTLAQEINVELSESPDSNDPDDWEAFLAAEGLIDDDMDLL
jgi:hypothetical protein